MYELSTISQAEVNASSGKNSGFVYTHLEVDDILGITAFIQPSSVDVFAALDTEYRGYINSGIKISDLFGKTTFIRPSSLDIHASEHQQHGIFRSTCERCRG